MRKNLSVIVAIALPILVVIGILIAVYVPTIGLETEYRIIYAVNNRWSGYYQEDFEYVVDGNKVEKRLLENRLENIKDYPRPQNEAPKLFIYDFQKEKSQEISYAEARDLNVLKAGNISPDDYHVEYTNDYNRAGIFEIFGGYSRDYGWKIEKDGSSVFKSDNTVNRYYSWMSPEVLGWIK